MHKSRYCIRKGCGLYRSKGQYHKGGSCDDNTEAAAEDEFDLVGYISQNNGEQVHFILYCVI